MKRCWIAFGLDSFYPHLVIFPPADFNCPPPPTTLVVRNILPLTFYATKLFCTGWNGAGGRQRRCGRLDKENRRDRVHRQGGRVLMRTNCGSFSNG